MPSMEMGDMGSPKLKVLGGTAAGGAGVNFGYWYPAGQPG